MGNVNYYKQNDTIHITYNKKQIMLETIPGLVVALVVIGSIDLGFIGIHSLKEAGELFLLASFVFVAAKWDIIWRILLNRRTAIKITGDGIYVNGSFFCNVDAISITRGFVRVSYDFGATLTLTAGNNERMLVEGLTTKEANEMAVYLSGELNAPVVEE